MQIISYTYQIKRAVPQYDCIDASWRQLEMWKPSYTHHKQKDVPPFSNISVYVPIRATV